MKTTIVLLALTAVCLAAEQTEQTSAKTPVNPPAKKTETTTKKLEHTTKKTEATTKKTEIPEGRGARMDISDAQLEMALKDKRYLQRQLKCTLGEAPCDPVGRRLRSLAPLVIRGSCPQCTATETRQIQKVLLHMQRNFPKEWAKVVRTYQRK